MNKIVAVYVVLSVAAIATLVFLLMRCEKKNCDGFCLCSSGGGTRSKVCQPNMKSLYRDGRLTEFTNFSAIQKAQGGAKWPTISPGDYDYPQVSAECSM